MKICEIEQFKKVRVKGRLYGVDELVSAQVVADLLGIPRHIIEQLARLDKLPFLKNDKKRTVYRIRDIYEWLRSRWDKAEY